MFRLSCHIHRNFASLFTNGKKSGASNAAARKVAAERWEDGWKREGGRNGKTVLKFPLAATAAAVIQALWFIGDTVELTLDPF